MNRRSLLSLLGSSVAAAGFATPAVAGESSLALQTPTGTIFGTLALPNGRQPKGVVLIVAGSGPTDRNGNNPLLPGKNDTYRLLATALAAEGFASVRYDKRGIGESAAAGGSERQLTFDAYIADAAAWLGSLHADARFPGAIVAGHSEGSLVGMVAARTAPCEAFVSLEGAGRIASVVLREQIKADVPPDQYAIADRTIEGLARGRTVPLPPSAPAYMQALFRDSVQPYLISWFKYDPAAEISKLRVPVTIVQGTADVQVRLDDAETLKAAAPGAKLVVVGGMNHLLRYAPDTSSQSAIFKGYSDPSLPIASQVVQAIVTAARGEAAA